MNYRDFFEKALSEAYREAPVTDDRTFVRMIDERARNMKNSNIKLHRVFGAVAGTAAAVAVVGGSVLGVNFLNEHGGLKEGGVAAYQAENEPSVTTNALMSAADITEPGVFRYDNCTLYVRDYTFDGMRVTISYDVVYDDPAAVTEQFIPDIVNSPDGTDRLTELGLNYDNWVLASEDGFTRTYPEDRPDTVCVTQRLVTMMPTDRIQVAFMQNDPYPDVNDERLSYDYTIVKNVPDGYISETTDIQVQPEGEERLIRVNICADCVELVYDEVSGVSLDTLFGAAGTARRTLTVNMKDGSSLTLAPPPGEAIFDKAYGVNNVVFTYYMTDTPIVPADVDSMYLGETFVLSDAQTEKQTTIAIDLSRAEAELGEFDLWFYIDGALQEELTRTIDFPGEERLEWDISAETGIHEYRIDVQSRGTGEVGTLFRGQVDFTNDTPQKLFGEGDDMEFNSGVFRKLNEALHGDPSQIAGIYPPEEGQEPLSEEEIEALVAESTERQLAEIKEKSPVLFDLFYNNQDLYASSSDPWLYGDEAWAVLAERGGLDGEYYIKGREALKDKFTFCHSGFFIEDGGLPVYPFAGGTVEYADWYQGWGRLVLVHSDDGHYWLYYHLADIGVREGDTVTTDTVLGNSGSTGFTTGTQLGIRVY